MSSAGADESVKAALFGVGLCILGAKHAQFVLEERNWTTRIVLQGSSSVRSKTGTDLAELDENILSTPAGFVTSRFAMAAGVVAKKVVAAFRDVEHAYHTSRRGSIEKARRPHGSNCRRSGSRTLGFSRRRARSC